ncbi:MAG: hypothetical protein LWY06_04065 [Firmicutes bacterium]|nr:hypothetical protein [Bacillota bacterium]
MHIAILIAAGKLLPGAAESTLAIFDVSLVKTPVIKPDMKTLPKSGANSQGINYYSKKSSKNPPGPLRHNNLPPGPKKPNTPSDAKPPGGDNAAPNLPLTVNLPKSSINKFNNDSNYPVYKKADNSIKDGAPSGQPDGIKGSQGTDGDIYGKGGGDGIKAGGGGGGGGGGGSTNFRTSTLQLCWETMEAIPFRYTGEEARRAYFASTSIPAYLVTGPGPSNQQDQEKAGTGYMLFELTVPASENVPEAGLPPSKIVFIEGKADAQEQFDLMKRLAMECMQNSRWYPSKRNGKPIENPFKLKLHFMGVVENKYTEIKQYTR